jgi:predicted nucleic-acid-binding protein
LIEAFLDSRELRVQDPDTVLAALHMAEHGADFADAVIREQHRRAGCIETKTFDRKAAQHSGMTLVAP